VVARKIAKTQLQGMFFSAAHCISW